MDNDILTVWNYMQLHEKADSADALIILGCRDGRVAAHRAWLAEDYSYKMILITGGMPPHNPSIESWIENSEAEHFLNVFQAKSQTKLNVLVESKAMNTGQNTTLSYELLKNEDIMDVKNVLLAMKPYMERRAVATFEAQWPTRIQYFELRLGR